MEEARHPWSPGPESRPAANDVEDDDDVCTQSVCIMPFDRMCSGRCVFRVQFQRVVHLPPALARVATFPPPQHDVYSKLQKSAIVTLTRKQLKMRMREVATKCPSLHPRVFSIAVEKVDKPTNRLLAPSTMRSRTSSNVLLLLSVLACACARSSVFPCSASIVEDAKDAIAPRAIQLLLSCDFVIFWPGGHRNVTVLLRIGEDAPAEAQELPNMLTASMVSSALR